MELKGRKFVMELTKATPSGHFRVGPFVFKTNEPQAVHFTKEQFEMYVKTAEKAIAAWLKVTPFDGEIKEGVSFLISRTGAPVSAEENTDKKELEEILSGGDPEVLLAFAKNKGEAVVSKDVLKKVLASLQVEFHGNSSFKTLLELLEEFVTKPKA